MRHVGCGGADGLAWCLWSLSVGVRSVDCGLGWGWLTLKGRGVSEQVLDCRLVTVK